MKENGKESRIGSLEFDRIVVKLGSALLFSNDENSVNKELMKGIVNEISLLRRKGKEVVIVSSGAIALGAQLMKLDKPPTKISERQALAAVGQSLLMSSWREAFQQEGFKVAQVLLTHDDLGNRKRFLNASDAIESMLKLGVIPIVNENDTVSVEEIRLGDNDRLSSLVAALIRANALIILSTASALFTKDPSQHDDAHRISEVEEINEEIEALASDSISRWGRGGMATKIEAARSASRFGIPTFIADGTLERILQRLLDGEDLGTLFHPEPIGLKGRKHWIGFTLKPAGQIYIDEGAENALVNEGKSLLPSGITSVTGEFGRGDCVLVCNQNDDPVAKGLSAYDSSEIKLIKGYNSNRVENLIGYRGSDEVIHRDDLVIEKHR